MQNGEVYIEQSIQVPLGVFKRHTSLKATRVWAEPIKSSTIKKHFFSKIKYSFGISLKKCVSAMFLHHFIRFYRVTS